MYLSLVVAWSSILKVVMITGITNTSSAGKSKIAYCVPLVLWFNW